MMTSECDINWLLLVLSSTDDKKTTRIIHYFLTELAQYKFTNVAVWDKCDYFVIIY